MKCPKCGGNNCQYIAAPEVHSKVFSSGNACCGFLLLGPAGMLCGLCGNETKTATKEYWICQECGYKFNVNREKISESSSSTSEQYNVKFVSESRGANESKQNDLWNRVQESYRSYIEGSVLESYFLLNSPVGVNEIYNKVAKKFVKSYKSDVKVVFAVAADEGLLLTERGFFINDTMIRNSELEMILLYNNFIYINQIAFKLHSDKAASILFRVITSLYSQIYTKRLILYPEVIEEIQKCKNRNTSSKSSFYNQQKYREYVEQLTKDYVESFQKLYPENNYEVFLKKKKLKKRAIYVMNTLEVILAILLLLTLGIIGPFISLGIFVGSVILVNTKIWNRYEQLIPEELAALIKENDYHMGDIDLLQCRESIKVMKKQIFENEYE